MTQHTIPTLFESFNARFLSPVQVAKTFVTPNQFEKLTGQHHTIILGPRGSGKTTLLKMLQQEALDAWKGSTADELRDRIGYYSVYIPTDVSWKKQVSSLGGESLDDKSKEILAIACFTIQIFKELIESMHYLVENNEKCNLSEELMSKLAREIAKTFKLHDECTSLLSVKYELGRKLRDIHAFAGKEAVLGEDGRKQRFAAEEVLHLSFLPCCSVAIDIFNDTTNQSNMRWAFLFDELEIAPTSIRKYLLESLRSVDGRFLFKLSLAPFGDDSEEFQDFFSASPGQDYEVISLWFSHKTDGVKFCQALWNSMLRGRNLPVKPPEKYLGSSIFDTDSTEWEKTGNAYSKGGKLATRFSKLAKKDSSFNIFLKENELDISNLDSLSGDKRAATVRKVTSIVAMREAFLMHYKNSSDYKLRSRHSTDLYTGASALFAITEGNPRWFKGMIGPMLDSLKGSSVKIPEKIQNQEIKKATQRFRALLRTIPASVHHTNRPVRGLLSVLDKIGDYFYTELIESDFNRDPHGTIIVDSRTNNAILEGLGKAINAGALVFLDSFDTPQTSLRGKRLRLAYLLAPHYRLLLRVERGVSLDHILSSEDEEKTLF